MSASLLTHLTTKLPTNSYSGEAAQRPMLLDSTDEDSPAPTGAAQLHLLASEWACHSWWHSNEIFDLRMQSTKL